MKKAAVIGISILLVLILLVVVTQWWEPSLTEKQVAKSAPAPTQESPQSDTAPASAPPGAPPTVEEGRVAVEKVTRMITAFHTRLGENPVGTNAEITRALLGGNPLHATFAPEDTPRLNAKGELIDPWGTPYFFHQISGNEMVIISAGPDKILGTADDIIQN